MSSHSEGVACWTHSNCRVIFRCSTTVINGKKVPVLDRNGKRVVYPIHIHD